MRRLYVLQVRLLYTELGLEPCLKANYKAQYTDKGAAPASPETAETRMIVFDGDFFRRIFPLLLSLHNARDLLAYMQYNVIKWGGGYCTQVHSPPRTPCAASGLLAGPS